jgi:hypothetical protein
MCICNINIMYYVWPYFKQVESSQELFSSRKRIPVKDPQQLLLSFFLTGDGDLDQKTLYSTKLHFILCTLWNSIYSVGIERLTKFWVYTTFLTKFIFLSFIVYLKI